MAGNDLFAAVVLGFHMLPAQARRAREDRVERQHASEQLDRVLIEARALAERSVEGVQQSVRAAPVVRSRASPAISIVAVLVAALAARRARLR